MSGTHGTTTTSGSQIGPTPPERTKTTGSAGSRPESVAAVAAVVRSTLPADAVISDPAQLRTDECDGLAH